MPTIENHSKTVIYNYFLGQTLGFGIMGYTLINNRQNVMMHQSKNINLLYIYISSTIVILFFRAINEL